MGREVRRVPLDFNHPLNTVWPGFVNTIGKGHVTPCPDCEHGYSPAYTTLKNLWYGYTPFEPSMTGSQPFPYDHPSIMAIARRNVGTHVGMFRECVRLAQHFNTRWNHHLAQKDVDVLWEEGRLSRDFKERPTAGELNEAYLLGMGHDSINCWLVIEARLKELGLPSACPTCDGVGELWDSPEKKKVYDEWEETAPPTGPGYQMWETVSEGSPISPVFNTPEDLAAYLVINDPGYASYEAWLAMIRSEGSSVSMIMQDGEITSGVEGMYSAKGREEG